MLVLPLPNYFWVQQIWSHFLGILRACGKEKWIDMDWLQERRPQTPNHGLYHQKSETEGSCTACRSMLFHFCSFCNQFLGFLENSRSELLTSQWTAMMTFLGWFHLPQRVPCEITRSRGVTFIHQGRLGTTRPSNRLNRQHGYVAQAMIPMMHNDAI